MYQKKILLKNESVIILISKDRTCTFELVGVFKKYLQNMDTSKQIFWTKRLKNNLPIDFFKFLKFSGTTA
ncbi:hypothetical protein BpHYR1_037054 [Brachionus plicatilis]|uniref:Uncharacterized protein n=1 Tax=Brachionus plicatilis TaxID=10195 RepID=A0A3M7SMV4_BRAPC|nr:hypothetical protein BpHYR1_037054 [Brachionus plicatilis]